MTFGFPFIFFANISFSFGARRVWRDIAATLAHIAIGNNTHAALCSAPNLFAACAVLRRLWICFLFLLCGSCAISVRVLLCAGSIARVAWQCSLAMFYSPPTSAPSGCAPGVAAITLWRVWQPGCCNVCAQIQVLCCVMLWRSDLLCAHSRERDFAAGLPTNPNASQHSLERCATRSSYVGARRVWRDIAATLAHTAFCSNTRAALGSAPNLCVACAVLRRLWMCFLFLVVCC